MGLSDIIPGLLSAFLMIAVFGDLLLEVDDQRFNVQHITFIIIVRGGGEGE